MKLHIISWNACGIKSYDKLAALKGYVAVHTPDVILIQEAFVGRPAPVGEAPSLSGYVSYVHMVRNGLVTYVHSTVQHQLIRNSLDNETTFQLLDVTFGQDKIRVCNVYSAPGRLNPDTFPAPTTRGAIYMGDFNARHPAVR